MVIKEELINFCKTTSIKGIPRAVKADQKGLRITWGILVILLLSMAGYMLYLLIDEFTNYPTYTITLEKVFDGETDKPHVPTLTLCNENPFSSLKPDPNRYNISTMEQYFNTIDSLTKCDTNCTVKQMQSAQTMRSILKTPSAYFQNLGLKASELIGHSHENFILECKELLFLGLTIYERPCTDLVNISLIQDIDYFNCYRVSLSNNFNMSEKGMIVGIQVVLYLDNIVSPESNNSILNFEPYIHNYGVIAIPHHPNGVPFPALDGLQISPGTSTRIHLAMIKSTRLEAPYGTCQQSTVEAYELLKICYSDCMQVNIRNRCHCTDSRMVKHKENAKTPFCLKLNATNPRKALQNFHCATQQLNLQELIACRDTCVLPCKEFHYRSEMSLSKWPNPLSMKAFYESYISGKDYENNFELVKSVVYGKYNNSLDSKVNLMIAQNLIEQNFLRLKLHISDIRYEDHEEKKKILWPDFISKLGSILNLWAGITIVAMLEVCEALVLIIQKCISKRKEPEKKEHEKNEITPIERFHGYTSTYSRNNKNDNRTWQQVSPKFGMN